LSRISSVEAPAQVHWPPVYFGVALTTLGTLIVELALTRIFSVVFYYHFAFLAISIALFGLGAGGVFSYVVAPRKGGVFSKLGALAALNGVVVVLALTFVITRTGQPGNGTVLLVYFISAAPFFLSGTVISLAISEAIERVDRVYFFDLVGASIGCFVLIPLLDSFGGPNTVIAAGVFFAVSAAIWYNIAGRANLRAAAVLLSLALVGLMFLNATRHLIDIKWAKGARLPHEYFVKWNSFSRIGLIYLKDAGFYEIVIDADASTGIPPYDWKHLDAKTRFTLLHEGPGLPYVLRPGAKTLIIGPGGGWDVARSLASGSTNITGVEINPIIATTIMRQKYPDLSHRLYFLPQVHIDVEDGRSFVRRTNQKYQVLQATLVDTWASTAAGAFALSENNLYTTDAFYDYLTHLTDDGILAFTRWGFDPPRESLRLVSLAIAAFDRLHEPDAWKHVIVARANPQNVAGWGAQDTVMIARKPFTSGDIERMRIAIREAGMDALYLPGDPPKNAFGQLLLSPDPSAFERNYEFDITPLSDDRPFFFYTVQPRDLWNFVRHASREAADYKINRAVPLLFSLVAVSLIATALILLLPRLLLGSRLPKDRGVFAFLFYFLFIGVGYILIQVALIQKFVLFLGHPTYALTVIIFSMLVTSGLGSFVSRKVAGRSDRRLFEVLGGVTVLIAILAFAVGPVTGAGVGLPLGIKVLIAALMIAPAGFLMGMPFPTGLAKLEQRHHASIRWAWSLNAAASVLGSGGAIFLAIYIGLRLTLLIGGCCYLGALAVAFATRRQAAA
jgi:hypothetical protein